MFATDSRILRKEIKHMWQNIIDRPRKGFFSLFLLVFRCLILYLVKNYQQNKPFMLLPVDTQETGKSMSTRALIHRGSKQNYSQQRKAETT